MENLKSLLQFGNRKIPQTTAIFNMGSALSCPSEKLGLCAVADICYAKKAERMYKASRPYRERQTAYWKDVDPTTFCAELLRAIKRKKNRVDLLRLNESGDFWSQECVDKAERIAAILYVLDIKVYTYTARKDLDFSELSFLYVNGSGFHKDGINNIFEPVDEFTGKNPRCLADCRKCSMCYSNLNHRTIEVLKH